MASNQEARSPLNMAGDAFDLAEPETAPQASSVVALPPFSPKMMAWAPGAVAYWRRGAGAVGTPRCALASDLRGGDLWDIVFVDGDQRNEIDLADMLAKARRHLKPSGAICLVADAASGLTRNRVGSALFRAGFEQPLMWAGRKALVAEARIHRAAAHFLPSSALGAGPRKGAFARSRVAANQILIMARKSADRLPEERNLRLSVVMPVFNEKATFTDVMERLLAKQIERCDIEIIIVESNSTDGTRDDVLRYRSSPRVKIVLEARPRGKGHAVRAGMDAASGDVILIQDADLEYDLDDYEKLLAPITRFEAGFVLGSRIAHNKEMMRMRQFKRQRALGNFLNLGHVLFTFLLNTIFLQRLKDPFTMYKVFRRDCIYDLRFECDRFDFDHELVGKLVRNGFSPTEIDVRYTSRSFDEGKKVAVFADPPTWVRALLKHRFSTLHAWEGAD